MRDRGIKKTSGTSELEGVVLGHLWKRGPCTTYSIRKELLQSPSSHWSASSGAIYPLLARFEERGLVRSRKAMRKNRAGWRYALTAAGRKRFLAWLGPPLAGEIVSIAADPLRTRVYFLGALSGQERAAFLASARAVLKRHLAELAPSGDGRVRPARVAGRGPAHSRAPGVVGRCAPGTDDDEPTGEADVGHLLLASPAGGPLCGRARGVLGRDRMMETIGSRRDQQQSAQDVSPLS